MNGVWKRFFAVPKERCIHVHVSFDTLFFLNVHACAGQRILVCVLFKEFLPKVIYDSSSVLCPMECGSEWFQDFTGSK